MFLFHNPLDGFAKHSTCSLTKQTQSSRLKWTWCWELFWSSSKVSQLRLAWWPTVWPCCGSWREMMQRWSKHTLNSPVWHTDTFPIELPHGTRLKVGLSLISKAVKTSLALAEADFHFGSCHAWWLLGRLVRWMSRSVASRARRVGWINVQYQVWCSTWLDRQSWTRLSAGDFDSWVQSGFRAFGKIIQHVEGPQSQDRSNKNQTMHRAGNHISRGLSVRQQLWKFLTLLKEHPPNLSHRFGERFHYLLELSSSTPNFLMKVSWLVLFLSISKLFSVLPPLRYAWRSALFWKPSFTPSTWKAKGHRLEHQPSFALLRDTQ